MRKEENKKWEKVMKEGMREMRKRKVRREGDEGEEGGR